MRRALHRAAASHVLVVLAALAAGAGLAGAALVGFSAEAQHQSSTFAGGWLAAPTALQAPAVSGYGAVLTWTHATHALTGQALVGTDQGTTSNCTGATYATSFATGLATTLNTTTDSRGSGANGHWICYQLQSTRGSWTKGANFSVVQVGLVPTTIVVASTSNANQISNGDTITLSFNQAVTYSGSSPITVCAFGGGANTILIGDTGCGSATDTPTIGAITGVSIPGASKTYPSSTIGAAGSTVMITIGGGGGGTNGRTAVTGTGTFTSTGSVITSTAGSAAVCTASNCAFAYSGAF